MLNYTAIYLAQTHIGIGPKKNKFTDKNNTVLKS